MSIHVDYQFNPFALSTTEKALEDSSNSQSVRICQAAGNIAYDIFLKNPYDLTIGNCKKLIEAKESEQTSTKIGVCATAVFGTLYTLMLYGTTFHVLGTSLAALGIRTGSVALSKAAEATKLFGKNLFVSGAVPIYGVCYALPKQIILALPPVVKAVTAKIEIAAQWTFHNVLTPLWVKVIFPAAQAADKALRFVAAKVGTALESISHAIVSTANEVFHKVLIPFWQNTLLPALKSIGQIAQHVMTKIDSALQMIEEKVAYAVKVVFQNVISPAWHKAILPALKAFDGGVRFFAKEIGQALSTIVSTVARSAQHVFQKFIVPMWNKLVVPALKFASKVINEVALVLKESLQYLAEATKQAASYVFQNAIVPAFNILKDFVLRAGELLGKCIIKPLGAILVDVANKAGHVFQTVFENLVIPVVDVVASSLSVLSSAMIEFKNEVWQAVNETVIRSRVFFSYA